MEVDLGSLIITKDGNCLKLKRSTTFKFWQWFSYSLIVVIVIASSAFFIKSNFARINAIFENGNMEQKGIVVGIFIFDLLFIVYLLWNIRRTTMDHEVLIDQLVLYIDSKHFSDLNGSNTVKIIRNIGWKGLGVSYSVAMAIGNKQRIIAYYLTERHVASTVNAVEHFIKSMTTVRS